MTKPEQTRAIAAWLAVCGWIALITTLSGEGFSNQSTSRFIGPLLGWLFPDAAPGTIEALHDGIRKTAHAVEYAVLAILASHAVRWSIPLGPRGSTALALTLVLAVATADETHQASLPERDGSLWDVALNGVGGAAGLGLFFAFRRTRGEGRASDRVGAGR